MKEDTIVLTTSKQSSCCKAFINQEFHNHVLSRGNNGVVGHGFRSWSNTELLVSYFCSHCGMTFKPTVNNKLNADEKEKRVLITELFDQTRKAIVVQNILPPYVSLFEAGKIMTTEKGEIDFLHETFSSFSVGSEIRAVMNGSRKIMSTFEQKPYFVKKGKEVKLVWWAEIITTSVPFSKAKKKELLAEQKKRKSSKIKTVNVVEDFFVKNIDKMSYIVPAKNKPLPKNALPAVKIFHPGSLKWFYVPENFIEFV